MVLHETPDAAIQRDIESLRELQSLLLHPETIASMNESSVNAMIARWLRRLYRIRMGGRSSALIALTFVLWRCHDRREGIRFDVEESLAFAFRMSVDPSLVFPEWAVVLAGVLIARYVDRIPKDAQVEIFAQCRLLLQHLERNHSSPIAVRNAAMTLLIAWDMGFPEGMNPVVRACLQGWPSTETIAAMPNERLDELMDHLNAILPACASQRELRIYRLGLERQGLWALLDNISLS